MTDNRTDAERFAILDRAFHDGDWAAIEAELGGEDGFPNVSAHGAIGLCLVYAIYHSPTELIVRLLDAGADPDRDENDGFPPLIAAFDRDDNQAEVIELLLQRGADVHQRGFNDYTPLHLAAARGDLGLVELLLRHGADANTIIRIDDMETPLELAEQAGHKAVAERLRPLTKRLDWESAAKSGDVTTLSAMVAAGQNINATDGYSQTALMRAAHAGRERAVDWLIANGAELNHTAKFGLSALMLAALSGHRKVVKSLIKAGADTSIKGTGAPGFAGKTAADLAEDRGDKAVVALLRKG